MVDRKPGDPAGQDACVGRWGGHAPHTEPLQGRLVMSWPRAVAPDIHLITVQAAVGERCIWVVTPNVPLHSHVRTPDGWATLIDGPDAPKTTTFHAYAVALHRGVFPDYEHGHRITAEVSPGGSLTYSYRLPGLAPEEVAAFMAIWERTWKRIHRGHRRKGQKSNITPNKERQIKRLMASLANQGLPQRAIAREVERQYPGASFDRRPWTHATIRQWLKEIEEDKASGKEW